MVRIQTLTVCVVFFLVLVAARDYDIINDDPSIAICYAGHYRTFFNPAVVAGHLAAFSHLTKVKRFAVLSTGAGTQHDGIAAGHLVVAGALPADPSHSEMAEFKATFATDLERYDLAGLRLVPPNDTFVNALLGRHCGPSGSCASVERVMYSKGGHETRTPVCSRSQLQARAYSHESPENWAEQCYKAAICGRLIGAYEAERGVAFEWVLKTRPDFMLLAPWPRFSAQFPSRAIVYLNKKRADHFFLCPRARCGPYFGGSAQQVSCATGPDFGFYSHLRVGFMGYDALDVGDIVYQYAFFRGTDPGRDATDSGLVCKSAVDKEMCAHITEVMARNGTSKGKVFDEVYSLVANKYLAK